MLRVLRPGGRVGISDVVAEDQLTRAGTGRARQLRRLHRRRAVVRRVPRRSRPRPDSPTSASPPPTRPPTACTRPSSGQSSRVSRPVVLFVCVHNAGRSQMAAGWLTHLAGDRVDVASAGSEPADRDQSRRRRRHHGRGRHRHRRAERPSAAQRRRRPPGRRRRHHGLRRRLPGLPPASGTRTGTCPTPPARPSTPYGRSAMCSGEPHVQRTGRGVGRRHERSGGDLWLAEVVATFGLLLVIFGVVRSGRASAAPFAVRTYIGAALLLHVLDQLRQPGGDHGPRALTATRSRGSTRATLPPSSWSSCWPRGRPCSSRGRCIPPRHVRLSRRGPSAPPS